MGTTWQQQYRQLTSNVETIDGEAYSARFITDAARNANVSHAYALAPIVVPNQLFPGGYLTGSESTTTYRMSWAPVVMPRPYRSYTIRVSARREGAAGTHTLTFTADRDMWNGSGTIHAASVNIVVSSATTAWAEGTLSPFGLDPFATPQVWFTLRSKSSDGATHARIFCIHIVGSRATDGGL